MALFAVLHPLGILSAFFNIFQKLWLKFFRFISSNTSCLCSKSKKEWDLNDPKQFALYKLYRPERVTPHKRGIDLLKTPGLNKVLLFNLGVLYGYD